MELAFYLTSGPRYGASEIRAELVNVEDGSKVRNISDTRWPEDTAGLAGLRVRATVYGDSANPFGREVVFAIEYEGAIDLRRSEAMTKTLRKVDAGLKRLSETLGDPLTFGTYVTYVARALGVKQFVVGDGSASTYDEMRMTWMSGGQAATWLDNKALALAGALAAGQTGMTV